MKIQGYCINECNETLLDLLQRVGYLLGQEGGILLTNNIIDIITSFATLGAAVSAAIAAYIAKKNVDEQRKMRISENRPLLVISNVEADQIGEKERFPFYINFINAGKGLAKIRVIDLNNSEIEAHIGTPISVAPNYTSCLKLWLQSREKQAVIKLSLYYWDTEGNGYRTEAQLFVSPRFLANGSWHVDWHICRENIHPYNNQLKMPEELLQWPRNELFSKAWWY